jgi:hypothetical protein
MSAFDRINEFKSELDSKLQILNEKTFNVDRDVDMIWNKYMKGLADDFLKNPDKYLDLMGKASDGTWRLVRFSSAVLTSEDAKLAHAKNPIFINVGILNLNAYNWKEKKIDLSLNRKAVNVLRYMTQEMVMDDYPLWIKEFSKEQLKSAIAHELSHWISDSLHNRHLKKRLSGNITEYNNLISKLGSINASDFEIDAQIHAFKELKRQHEDKWDEMTFDELIKLKPAMNHIVGALQTVGKKTWDKWNKRIFGRMVRENLLGKNMRPIPHGKYKKI